MMEVWRRESEYPKRSDDSHSSPLETVTIKQCNNSPL